MRRSALPLSSGSVRGEPSVCAGYTMESALCGRSMVMGGSAARMSVPGRCTSQTPPCSRSDGDGLSCPYLWNNQLSERSEPPSSSRWIHRLRICSFGSRVYPHASCLRELIGLHLMGVLCSSIWSVPHSSDFLCYNIFRRLSVSMSLVCNFSVLFVGVASFSGIQHGASCHTSVATSVIVIFVTFHTPLVMSPLVPLVQQVPGVPTRLTEVHVELLRLSPWNNRYGLILGSRPIYVAPLSLFLPLNANGLPWSHHDRWPGEKGAGSSPGPPWDTADHVRVTP